MIAAPPGFLNWTVKVQPSIATATWYEVVWRVARPFPRWQFVGAFPTFREAAMAARLVKWAMG